MANVKRIWDVNKGDTAKDKKEEFFSGGGAQSGTGVVRPIKKTDDEMAQLAQMQQSQGMKADSTMEDTITIYKNGFKIGNGEFRPDTDPTNKKFLEELKAGSLPKELEPILMEKLGPQARQLGVNVVNKSKEEYEPPAKEKPKFEAFKGQGHSLGGGNDAQLNESFANAEKKEIEPSNNKETTKIQIVLFNNKKVTITVNLDNTILELYAHVKSISGIESEFDLLGGYPPKPLADPTATILSAGLKGARVTQKSRK